MVHHNWQEFYVTSVISLDSISERNHFKFPQERNYITMIFYYIVLLRDILIKFIHYRFFKNNDTYLNFVLYNQWYLILFYIKWGFFFFFNITPILHFMLFKILAVSCINQIVINISRKFICRSVITRKFNKMAFDIWMKQNNDRQIISPNL